MNHNDESTNVDNICDVCLRLWILGRPAVSRWRRQVRVLRRSTSGLGLRVEGLGLEGLRL